LPDRDVDEPHHAVRQNGTPAQIVYHQQRHLHRARRAAQLTYDIVLVEPAAAGLRVTVTHTCAMLARAQLFQRGLHRRRSASVIPGRDVVQPAVLAKERLVLLILLERADLFPEGFWVLPESSLQVRRPE
jgi:hypothetical protein